jgi:hypothetical protein
MKATNYDEQRVVSASEAQTAMETLTETVFFTATTTSPLIQCTTRRCGTRMESYTEKADSQQLSTTNSLLGTSTVDFTEKLTSQLLMALRDRSGASMEPFTGVVTDLL